MFTTKPAKQIVQGTDPMKTDFLSLSESSLFANVNAEELQQMYKCISARERAFERDSFVISVGQEVRYVYLILSGSVHIIDEDFWGNRSIIETMVKDTLFGEAYVFSTADSFQISVIAAEDSLLLEIDPTSLFETCSNKCACHTQLVRNALHIVSEKIVLLTEKLQYIMRRSIREKVLSYLSQCSQREKNSSFYIPYSRQQLADYLCVDRSALSHELSKLQAQGMIKYHKNRFELLLEPEDI